MPTSTTPSGRTPSTPSGIETELVRLQRRVDELRRVQARSRRITMILAIIVVAEFAAFTFYTTRNVQANFNKDDVQRAVAQRVPELTPVLRERLVSVAQHTFPVYKEEATKTFQKTGPQVARDALERLQRLPEENGQELNKHLQIAFEVAVSRVEPDMKSAFPSLSDEQKTSILHQEFLGAVSKENDDIAKHITEISENELKTMKQVLQKFDVPSETSDEGRRTREREFLHALVDVMMDGEFTLKTPPAPTTRPTPVAVVP
jgi:hypothetical protein